jgi:hypothetical protein
MRSIARVSATKVRVEGTRERADSVAVISDWRELSKQLVLDEFFPCTSLDVGGADVPWSHVAILRRLVRSDVCPGLAGATSVIESCAL